MSGLLKYVDADFLRSLNFRDIASGSIVYGDYRVYLGYNIFKEKRFVIIAKESERGKRSEWYVGAIPVSLEDACNGILDNEFNEIMAVVRRKNRVAGRDISKRLTELANSD